jgi:hypothetical protein
VNKAEMQEHHAKYQELMAEARSKEKAGSYRDAIKLALASWDHIDGMMQYRRRYEDVEFRTVEAIDMVLKYAPLLLDFASLDALEWLLKDRRRIEKHTSDSLADSLAEARSLMWDAHRLWDHLEFHPDARQDELREHLGGNQERWRALAAAWETMGLVERVSEGRSYRLALCTRMGKIVPGKCPSCGAVSEAPKAMFLEDTTCPKCGDKVSFVLLAPDPTVGSKG